MRIYVELTSGELNMSKKAKNVGIWSGLNLKITLQEPKLLGDMHYAVHNVHTEIMCVPNI